MHVLEAVQLFGRPKLFVCISVGRVGWGGTTRFRVFGHYAASHEWNRVIEQPQGVRSPRPPARNATDRPRPAVWSGRGASVVLPLDAQVIDRLRDLAHDAGTTLYVVLLAALQALLYRSTGQTDITGTKVLDRM